MKVACIVTIASFSGTIYSSRQMPESLQVDPAMHTEVYGTLRFFSALREMMVVENQILHRIFITTVKVAFYCKLSVEYFE